MRLLNLFAQGTWSDYAQASDGVYPKLTNAQEAQLRRLSLVSLSHTSRCLSYTQIASALGLAHDSLATEHIVLDTIDLGMLNGHLDGIKEVFYVHTTSGRDVLPLPEGEGAMSSLHAAISTWKDDVAQVLQSLDNEIQQLQDTTEFSATQREARHKALVDALQSARAPLGLNLSARDQATLPALWETHRGKRTRS